VALTVATPTGKPGMLEVARHGHAAKAGAIMNIKIRTIAPWLAAAALASAVGLAPVAGASVAASTFAQSNVVAHSAPAPSPAPAETGPDPLVPYGTEPTVPFRLGYVNPNHDEGNTTNGELDVPF
jgi:hypothetical protein